MLQSLRISGGGGSTAYILVINNTDEIQSAGAAQFVSLNIGSTFHLFQTGVQANLLYLGPGEGGAIEDVCCEPFGFTLEVTQPSLLELFQPANVDVIRSRNSSVYLDGVVGSAELDYAVSGGIEFNYIPGTEPPEFLPVGLALLSLVLRRRHKGKAPA